MGNDSGEDQVLPLYCFLILHHLCIQLNCKTNLEALQYHFFQTLKHKELESGHLKSFLDCYIVLVSDIYTVGAFSIVSIYAKSIALHSYVACINN